MRRVTLANLWPQSTTNMRHVRYLDSMTAGCRTWSRAAPLSLNRVKERPSISAASCTVFRKVPD
eukprot:scaffold102069_cov32-Tisochrysis_lutea.AAC.4